MEKLMSGLHQDRLNRMESYLMVWEEPTIVIARDWGKIAHDHKVRKPPLSAVKAGVRERRVLGKQDLSAGKNRFGDILFSQGSATLLKWLTKRRTSFLISSLRSGHIWTS